MRHPNKRNTKTELCTYGSTRWSCFCSVMPSVRGTNSREIHNWPSTVQAVCVICIRVGRLLPLYKFILLMWNQGACASHLFPASAFSTFRFAFVTGNKNAHNIGLVLWRGRHPQWVAGKVAGEPPSLECACAFHVAAERHITCYRPYPCTANPHWQAINGVPLDHRRPWYRLFCTKWARRSIVQSRRARFHAHHPGSIEDLNLSNDRLEKIDFVFMIVFWHRAFSFAFLHRH